MQVIMTMEEYQELLNKEKKLEKYYQTQLLGVQNKFILQMKKLEAENRELIQKLERMR